MTEPDRVHSRRAPRATSPATRRPAAARRTPRSRPRARTPTGARPSLSSFSRARSSRRRILPLADFGTASMNSTRRTRLYGAVRSATKARTSSSVAVLPGARTTNAFGTSSPRSSYTPITAASATSGRGEQHGLQLGRRHLVALVLDQLLDPVDDEPPAVVVDARRCRRCAASRRRRSGCRSPPAGRSSPSSAAARGSRSRPPRPGRRPPRSRRRPAAPRCSGTSLPTVPGGAGRVLRDRARGGCRARARSSRRPGRSATPSRAAAIAASSASSGAAARRRWRSSADRSCPSTAGCLAKASDDRRRHEGPRDPLLLQHVEELLEVEARQHDHGRARRSGRFISTVMP